MLPLTEVLAYVDVMDQVADDFILRLRRVHHQLLQLDAATTTLEHELLQCALESTHHTGLFLGSHAISLRAFCNGRRVCHLSVPRQISKTERDRRDISSPL